MQTINYNGKQYRVLDYTREAQEKSKGFRELVRNLREHTPYSPGDIVKVYHKGQTTRGKVIESHAYGTKVALRGKDGTYSKRASVPTEHVLPTGTLSTKKQRQDYHREEIRRVDAALADLRRKR